MITDRTEYLKDLQSRSMGQTKIILSALRAGDLITAYKARSERDRIERVLDLVANNGQ